MTMDTAEHPAHTQALSRMEREERRAEVARMLVRHIPYREIGAELGVSHQTVANDVNVIKERWRDRSSTDYDALVSREEFKLDEMERALTPLLETKDRAEAVRGLVRIAERRAKLLGLDAPARVEHTGSEGGPIEVSVEELGSKANAVVNEYERRLTAVPGTGTDG